MRTSHARPIRVIAHVRLEPTALRPSSGDLDRIAVRDELQALNGRLRRWRRMAVRVQLRRWRRLVATCAERLSFRAPAVCAGAPRVVRRSRGALGRLRVWGRRQLPHSSMPTGSGAR